MALRYLLISGHYRQPLNFTFNGIEAAQSAVNKLEKSISEILEKAKMNKEDFIQLQQTAEVGDWGQFDKAWEALINDLNTPTCLGNIFSALNKIDASKLKENETLLNLNALARLTYALGLELFYGENGAVVAPDVVRKLADERWVAKQDKDFTKADELREQIQAEGWQVHDRKDTYDLEPVWDSLGTYYRVDFRIDDHTLKKRHDYSCSDDYNHHDYPNYQGRDLVLRRVKKHSNLQSSNQVRALLSLGLFY